MNRFPDISLPCVLADQSPSTDSSPRPTGCEEGNFTNWPEADALSKTEVSPRTSDAFVSALGRSESTDPIPNPLPPVPHFTEDLLPACVRRWCVDAADSAQVPLDYVAIPTMVTLAAAIGRTVAVAMKRHGRWYELPILWGFVVGRPSSGKTPALMPARRMLERLTALERVSYEAALRDFEVEALIAEASKANSKKAMQSALKKGDRRAATIEAEAALSHFQSPTEPRIMVNDVTVEKLGELLNANPRGLVQFRDELAGWLASLDREGREGRPSDRAFWLECWNGSGTFTVDRIGRGTIRIEACAMSIFGGMQPGKLAEYVRGAVRGGFSDDGLMQRFQLVAYPDPPSSWRYTDPPPDPLAEEEAWATFKRLRELDPLGVGAEVDPSFGVPVLHFDDEAQKLLIDWQTRLMQRLRAGEEPVWIESHLAKFPSLVGRLALVLHLAGGEMAPIRAETLATAIKWCDYLEAHARRVYAPAVQAGSSTAHLIVRRKKELGAQFSRRELMRHNWAGLSDPEAVEQALDLLVEYGHLCVVEQPTGGRPLKLYVWKVP